MLVRSSSQPVNKIVVTEQGHALLRNELMDVDLGRLQTGFGTVRTKNEMKNLLMLREKIQQAANSGILSKMSGRNLFKISDLRTQDHSEEKTRSLHDKVHRPVLKLTKTMQSSVVAKSIDHILDLKIKQQTIGSGEGIQQGPWNRTGECLSPTVSRKEFSSEPQTPFMKSVPVNKESLKVGVSESKSGNFKLSVNQARDQLFKVEEEIQLLVRSTTDASDKTSAFVQQRLQHSLKDIKQLRESMRNDGTWGNFLRCLRPKKTLSNMTALSEVDKSQPIDAIPLNAFALNNLKLQSKMLETAVQSKVLEIQKQKIRVMRVVNQHRRTQSGCCIRDTSQSRDARGPELDSHRQFWEYSQQRQEIYSGLANIRSQLRKIQVDKGVQPRWEEKQTLGAAERRGHSARDTISAAMREDTPNKTGSTSNAAEGFRRIHTRSVLNRPVLVSDVSPRHSH